MSGTKRIIFFVFSFCIIMLSACKKEEKAEADLYREALSAPSEIQYTTSQVKTGDFIRSAGFDAEVCYPDSERVTYQGKAARLKGFTVRVGQEVKKGDTVAELTVEYDEIELEELELKLAKAQRAYEQGLKSRADQKRQIEERRAAASDPYEKKKAGLELEKAALERSQFISSSEKELEKQKKELQVFREEIAVTRIKAPADGLIGWMETVQPGERIEEGVLLAILFNPDNIWFYIKDTSGVLRYNMDVAITTGSYNKQAVYHGRVIQADNLLPESIQDDSVYVKLTEEVPEGTEWVNLSAKADTVKMEDACLIPKTAVTQEGDRAFVSLLTDGAVKKRYIRKLDQNPDYVWAAWEAGIKENAEVILQK